MTQTRTAKDVFRSYLEGRGLKWTRQREQIVDFFLAQERHFSAEELHDSLKGRRPAIGYTTVYRTLKLLAECGVARAAEFADGVCRFEHEYGHAHHDHLVCVRCGRFVEFTNSSMERLQDEIARQHGFASEWHRMQIYGRCRKCR